ncbi:uroporphyrinogen decarboxylase family protein [Eubacterium sp. 1001713B170207_170306_E7]|uniref:uroporphyrinogen decarboxylase family protein n=1 Tax=Eubacterium sp. 1001713B170207_170306_E7 TaxID=2787097 RepID=UPI00189B9B5F|nr:uroporphyrinogen decarboxylase family protein [Eubacterium sp. 1001713B170207_170306_E7]
MEFSQETLKRNKLFENVYDLEPPERVPMMVNGDNAFCLEYAGFSLKAEQYSVAKNLEAIETASRDFDSDVVFGAILRQPQIYSVLRARNFMPGTDGFIQHPEVHGMEVEDYDAFIADPYKTICDTVLPRIYGALEEGGFKANKAFARAFSNFITGFLQPAGECAAIAARTGRSVYNLATTCSPTSFDSLADQLRSFTGISKDIRRVPDKVEAACEAMLPLTIKAGITPMSDRYRRTFIPLHMAPYMREKDFKRFYWPTFKAYVEALDKAGIGANIMVEQDWSRYLDYLNELPEGTALFFEYGDPEEIKQKVGGRQIISGLYPLNLLKTGTVQECVDKAKQLLDILAPGGKYIFSFDKSLLRLKDVRVDNLKAVLSCVKEYGKY